MARVSVFISYSSQDEAFALSLRDELQAEHEIWIDSQHIPAGTRFRDSIQTAIESCEAMIVVLTTDWLASAECQNELSLAVDLHKRIVPVERYRLSERTLPPALNGLSPIAFWRTAGRKAAMEKLGHDLVADHAWIQSHRDLLVDALRWQRSQGEDVRLRGPALRSAVRIVERAAAGLSVPDLIPVQRDYVRACEAVEAAEVERLTLLNRRVVSRHLASEAQRAWAADVANIGLALRLAVESFQRAPSSAARSLANELVAKLPPSLATLPESEGAAELVFSRDGWLLAFACGSRVQVWRTYAGTCLINRELGARVLALRLDRDALVTLSVDGKVRRIMLTSGRETVVADVRPEHAVLADDGRRVAWTSGSAVFVQPVETPGVVSSRFELPLQVHDLALSPTGPHLLACAQGPLFTSTYLVRLINAATGTSVDLHDQFHMDPAFSPDGRFVAARGHGSTRVWDVATGMLSRELSGQLHGWSPGSQTAITALEQLWRTDEPSLTQCELLEWDIKGEDRRNLMWLDRNPHDVSLFDFRGRSMLAFAAAREVQVVDVRLGMPTAIVPHIDEDFWPRLAVAPGGSLLATASRSEAVRVFDLTPESDDMIGPFVAAVEMVAASRDGHWIARSLYHTEGSDYGAMMPSPGEVGPRGSTAGRVSQLAISNVGTFAAILQPVSWFSSLGSGERGTAALVIAQTKGTTELPRSASGRAVAISSDGQQVAEIAADGTVCWIDVDEPTAHVVLPAQDAVAAEFDDSGRYLLVSSSGRIEVFDTASGDFHPIIESDTACACFGYSSKLWIADNAGRLRCIELPSGQELQAVLLPFVTTALLPGDNPVHLLAVHQDTVVILDTESGRIIGRMKHLDYVNYVLRSCSGRHIFVFTRSGRSFVWDIETALQVLEIDTPDATAVWLAGDRLAVVIGDRINVVPAASDELIRKALVRAGGPLTQQEWETYLPDEPWPGAAAAKAEDETAEAKEP